MWYSQRCSVTQAQEKRTNFHTITFSSGTYFAFPFATLQSAFVAFKGVGILNTIFVADSLLLKIVLRVIVYCTWVVPTSVTLGMIRMGSFTFEVERYLSSRNIIQNQNQKPHKINQPHQLKIPIRRYKTDRPRSVKIIQPHALMESTIV